MRTTRIAPFIAVVIIGAAMLYINLHTRMVQESRAEGQSHSIAKDDIHYYKEWKPTFMLGRKTFTYYYIWNGVPLRTEPYGITLVVEPTFMVVKRETYNEGVFTGKPVDGELDRYENRFFSREEALYAEDDPGHGRWQELDERYRSHLQEFGFRPPGSDYKPKAWDYPRPSTRLTLKRKMTKNNL